MKHFPLITVLALLSACRSSSSIPSGTVPAPMPEPSSPVERVKTEQRWIITPASTQHRFSSSSNTSLELQDSAGSLRDSLVSNTTYSLQTTRQGESLSYAVTVESMSIQGGQRVNAPGNTTIPLSLSGQLGKDRISTDSALNCTNDAASAISGIQRALMLIPLALYKDMTWKDSLSTAGCSGSIPVTLTMVRTYRVLGETSQGLLIERRDQTSTAGEGSQGQHVIRIRTKGSGSAEMAIDRQTGELIQSTSTSVTTVTITSSGRDQKFTQTVRERTQRL